MTPGQVQLGLAFTGSYLSVEHNTTVEPEPGVAPADEARTHALQIGLMQFALDGQFGFHERFAAEFSLPINANLVRADFLDANGDAISDYASIHHRDETIAGVGDLQLAGRVALVTPKQVLGWNLQARLGAALPSGRIQPDPFSLAAVGQDHQHMFFGSGTVDPIVGLQSTVSFDKWSLLTTAEGRFRAYRNRHGYNAGQLVSGSVGALSSFGLERWNFLFQPELQYASAATWDRGSANTQSALNSGRLVALVGVGAFFTPTPQWQVYTQIKAPIVIQAQGGNLRWPIVGTVGFRYRFEMKSAEPHVHEHGDGHDHGAEAGGHDHGAEAEGHDH